MFSSHFLHFIASKSVQKSRTNLYTLATSLLGITAFVNKNRKTHSSIGTSSRYSVIWYLFILLVDHSKLTHPLRTPCLFQPIHSSYMQNPLSDSKSLHSFIVVSTDAPNIKRRASSVTSSGPRQSVRLSRRTCTTHGERLARTIAPKTHLQSHPIPRITLI